MNRTFRAIHPAGNKNRQHRPHPRRPARFIMRAPLHLLKVQRLARPPSICLQPPRQELHVPQRLVALLIAHVQPEPRPLPQLRSMLVHVANNALVVPPHARRQHRQFAKALRMAQPKIQRHQTAERRPAEPRRRALLPHAILRRNPRHQLARDHQPVAVGLAAAHLPVLVLRVFSQAPVAGVVDAHNHQRLNLSGLNRRIGVLAHLPRPPRHKRSPPIEEILPIVHVEHGVSALRLLVITRRHIHNHVALIGQIDAAQTRDAAAAADAASLRSRPFLGQISTRLLFQFQS